jgi:hypothetical protein
MAPPNQMAPTEARQLDNYYCLDWGVRQRTAAVVYKDIGGGAPFGVGMFVPYARLDPGHVGDEAMLVTSQRRVFRISSPTDLTLTDVTGSVTISGAEMSQSVIFNNHILLFNGVNPPILNVLLTSGSFATASFTGPADISKLYQPTTFKSRLYITELLTTKFWYGGIGAVNGALSSFDVAQVLQSGGTIAALVVWSYNQGIGSEEFLVVISTLGEVLIYSGDYPAATNWQLAGRTQIPRPIGTRSVIRVAQDVYVYTMRGIVALSRVFSGNTDDRYYIVSNKLGPNMRGGSGCDTRPGYNPDYPFLYFVGDQGRVLYVLNYERGAWSRFTYWPTIVPRASTVQIFAVAVAFGRFWVGTGSATANIIYRCDDFLPSATSAADEYIWKTPFLGFDNGFEKSSKYVRVVARDMGTSPIRNTVSIATEFQNTDQVNSGITHPNEDTQTTPAPVVPIGSLGPDWIMQELRPPGNGRTISYIFARAGQGEVNEVSGAEVMIETGGAY